jgi:hypothetical protein
LVGKLFVAILINVTKVARELRVEASARNVKGLR